MSICDHENRRTLYAVLGLSALLVFLLGALVGIAVAELRDNGRPKTELTDYSNPPDVPSKGNSIINPDSAADRVSGVSSIGEKSVLPDDSVLVKHIFAACGDEITEPYPEDLTGYTESALKELCDTVEGLGTGNVMLIVHSDGCCPQHYLLKYTQGTLMVLTADPQTYQRLVVATIDVNLDVLPNATAQELTEGVLFERLSEIDQYIESIES